jgi:hypothetical protein
MGMPAYGAPPGGPGARFCVIKLKGLPFGVKDYEIGLFLVGIIRCGSTSLPFSTCFFWG